MKIFEVASCAQRVRALNVPSCLNELHHERVPRLTVEAAVQVVLLHRPQCCCGVSPRSSRAYASGSRDCELELGPDYIAIHLVFPHPRARRDIRDKIKIVKPKFHILSYTHLTQFIRCMSSLALSTSLVQIKIEMN